MLRDRTFLNKKIATAFHQERFYPSGNYTWRVPEGCESVDVFLVGGGGGCANVSAGAGGYTKCYKQDLSGYKDGNQISVTPGQNISIIVGAGGDSVNGEYYSGHNGGYSQFASSLYRANGGNGGTHGSGYSGGAGDGGSGGCGWYDAYPGSDGSDGTGGTYMPSGKGQGHTTRDFGEPSGNRNAGGGGCTRGADRTGGASDYQYGTGSRAYGDVGWGGGDAYAYGGGGYGGGAAGAALAESIGPGGDGTVLIRYYAYK